MLKPWKHTNLHGSMARCGARFYDKMTVSESMEPSEQLQRGAGLQASSKPDFDLLLQKNAAEVLEALDTAKDGLPAQKQQKRLAIFGYNDFAKKREIEPVFIFLSKFRNPILV